MKSVKQTIFNRIVNQVISHEVLRRVAVRQLDKKLYHFLMNGEQSLLQVKLDQYTFNSALIYQAKKNLDKGFIKPKVTKKTARVFVGDYGFRNPGYQGNFLMPCSIRDHYKNFKQNIITPDAKGEDPDAEAALHDPEYEKILVDFDRELKQRTDSLFTEIYLNSKNETPPKFPVFKKKNGRNGRHGDTRKNFRKSKVIKV